MNPGGETYFVDIHAACYQKHKKVVTRRKYLRLLALLMNKEAEVTQPLTEPDSSGHRIIAALFMKLHMHIIVVYVHQYLVTNQVQAAYQQDLAVQGGKCLLYKVLSVYCASMTCVLYRVYRVYYTGCAVCILHQNLARTFNFDIITSNPFLKQ